MSKPYVILFLFIFLTSCSSHRTNVLTINSTPFETPMATLSPTVTRSSQPSPLQDVEERPLSSSSASLPKIDLLPEWTYTDNLNENAVIQAVKKSSDAFMIVLRQDKQSIKMNLKEYSQAALKNISDSSGYSSQNSEFRSEIDVAGFLGIRYLPVRTFDDITVQYQLNVIDYKDSYLQIVFWVPLQSYPRTSADFEKIIQSLK